MMSPPTFLEDYSSWNDNQHAEYRQVASSADHGRNHDLPKASIMPEGHPEGGDGCKPVRRMKPTPMAECARLARIALPEQGLKCPRCESTNTRFCYFNNYSLTQPRHLCRVCRRHWTHGGTLRRSQAKRAKPKLVAAAAASGASAPAGSTMSSACITNSAPAVPTTLDSNQFLLPPLPLLLSLPDSETMSLSSSFSGMGKPLVDTVGYFSVSGGGSASDAGLEQWRVQQMQSFPFFHVMDKAALASTSATATRGPIHYI